MSTPTSAARDAANAALSHHAKATALTRYARSLVVKGGYNPNHLRVLGTLARAAGVDPQEARAAVDAGIAQEDRRRRQALGPI